MSRIFKNQTIYLIIITFTLFFASWLNGDFIFSSRQSSIIKTYTDEFCSISPTNSYGSIDQLGDQWPMFHAALNHSGVDVTTPIQGAGPTWNYKTNNTVFSSPAIAGGRVYVGGMDKKIYCLRQYGS